MIVLTSVIAYSLLYSTCQLTRIMCVTTGDRKYRSHAYKQFLTPDSGLDNFFFHTNLFISTLTGKIQNNSRFLLFCLVFRYFHRLVIFILYNLEKFLTP